MNESEPAGTMEGAAPGKLPAPWESLPALIEGLPAAEYHAGPGVSRSNLTKFKHSPAHYVHSRSEPFRQTPAMRLGSLTHMAILEPERFATSVAFEPDFGDCRFKENKLERDKWRAAHAGAELCTVVQFNAIKGMRDAIMAHPAARALLLGAGCKREASLYWTDAETGLMCRARPDVLRGDGIMPDLKTCEDASPDAVQRSIWNFGYYLEAAHYGAGLHAYAGIAPRPFPFVFVESEPPHGVAVYVLDENSMQFAESERRALLRAFADCTASNKWPAYPETIQAISLPAWAMRAASNDNRGDL